MAFLSPELSRVAQEYSETLKTANAENLEHSENVDFGENLAFYQGSREAEAKQITDQWYSSRDGNNELAYSSTQITELSKTSFLDQNQKTLLKFL